jgi:hypothetical protein
MPKNGPVVYLDYDQAALDAAYDQAAYAPNREQLIKRRISDSELSRQRIGEPERVTLRTGRYRAARHLPHGTRHGAGQARRAARRDSGLRSKPGHSRSASVSTSCGRQQMALNVLARPFWRQLRPNQRQLPVPIRSASSSLFVISDAWLEEDQLPQQPTLPRLPDPIALHRQSIPLRVTSRERGRTGSNAGRIAQRPDILDQRRESAGRWVVALPWGRPAMLPCVGLRATSRSVVLGHILTYIAGRIPTFTVAPIPIMEPVLSRQVLSPALLLVPQQPPHTTTPITRSPIIRLPVDRHIPRTRPPAQTPIEMIVVSAEP